MTELIISVRDFLPLEGKNKGFLSCLRSMLSNERALRKVRT